MKLTFFGRGSGFTSNHTSAYFVAKKDLVIIDCPVSTFQKLMNFDLKNRENIYVAITHTHGDHVGGLGLFIQYTYFVLHKKLTVLAPSFEVRDDIFKLLEIEGNDSSWYNLKTPVDMYNKKWFKCSILTKHSPNLEGKCFGYYFYVNGTNIIYTGDTAILDPFIPYLTSNSELYVDVSVSYGLVHLKLEDALNDFIKFSKCGVKVYLMHLDDAIKAEEVVKNLPGIEVVKTL